MQIWHSGVTSINDVDIRRRPLSISSLLNEESIDPIQKPPPRQQYVQNYFQYCSNHGSPQSSIASSPNSISESDLWNHSRTGMHQTNAGQIIVSSVSKAKRKRILPQQYNRLISIFENTDTPSSEIRIQLAEELDMTTRQVQVWFQNRRAKAKLKTKKRCCPYHHPTKPLLSLESSYQPPY